MALFAPRPLIKRQHPGQIALNVGNARLTRRVGWRQDYHLGIQELAASVRRLAIYKK